VASQVHYVGIDCAGERLNPDSLFFYSTAPLHFRACPAGWLMLSQADFEGRCCRLRLGAMRRGSDAEKSGQTNYLAL